MNYYKISNKSNIVVLTEAEDILSAVFRLLTLSLQRNKFPFDELHIVSMSKEEFESLGNKITEDNYDFLRRN